jgi:signal transduction histidine kinase
MMDQLTFKVSSGLKNLIGKELITDEYIAIFELVKNSFDAHATNVQVIFEHIYSNNPKIIIVDNGKGMNLDDIKDRWLFVAYSAKKDGTEDNTNKDYRDKIQPKRMFAGAKGVGRFSCDRLGSHLNLITLKDEKNSSIESIKINWTDFEKNSKEEFVEIGIVHEKLSNTFYNIEHGTIIEIESLRDDWNRDKLLKLKKSLEKLINPNQESDDFSIEIIALDEVEKDSKEENDWNIINGKVRNTVFEKLDLKTTHVMTKITDDGSKIITTLFDRGKYIYSITEKNLFELSHIDINLFYLNRAAKFNFSKLMGVRSVSYGSVFMYKNGFRIYPYGEVGEDPLNLDKRKVQGHSRYLGTRELIGRIEIFGEENNLVETTSRDGGFIKNKSYEHLVEFFVEKSLKILEKYVVSIIKWGEPFFINKDDEEKHPALNPEDVKKDIVEYIKKLSSSENDVINVDYNKDFLELIEKSKENSATKVINDLAKKAIENGNNTEIQKEIEKVGKKFTELLTERKELEIEKEKKIKELKIKHKELEQTTSQNLFLKSVASTDTKELISLQHHINHGTVRINRNIDRLKDAIERNASKDELNQYIEIISLENNKISTISKFVTKANFNLTSSAITTDLIQFINEYIENVYKEYKHLQINNHTLFVTVENPNNLEYKMKFRPLEIIIIIDNLLNNSLKAKAKNVILKWKQNVEKLELIYKDDGIGIPDEHIDKILDFGFTTTNGSGLGMYHIGQIIHKMNGYIRINNKVENGVEFILGVSHGS